MKSFYNLIRPICDPLPLQETLWDHITQKGDVVFHFGDVEAPEAASWTRSQNSLVIAP